MPYYLGDVVTDQYLQDLLRSYRQGYVDAHGPDFEDSDAPLLALFASANVRSNATAYTLGAQQAAIDIANQEDVHPTAGWSAATPIPSQVAPNPVVYQTAAAVPTPAAVTTAMPERSDAEVYATFQRSTGVAPSNANSGPAGAFGYGSFPQLSGYVQPQGSGSSAPGAPFSLFGLDLTTLLMLLAAGVGAYLLLKKK